MLSYLFITCVEERRTAACAMSKSAEPEYEKEVTIL